MIWRAIALLLGFKEARDAEDDRLVVFREDLHVHFYSWRDAVVSRLP